MRIDKQSKRFARKLLQLSLEDGNVSEARVGEVLNALRKNPPRQYGNVLRAYRMLVSREISQSTAVVESAAEVPADVLKSIESHYSGLYGRPITAVVKANPALIAGLRIQVGDDCFDASVAGRLERLAAGIR